jgi:hypothetical protein
MTEQTETPKKQYVLVEESSIDSMENRFHRAILWDIVGVFPKDSFMALRFANAGFLPFEAGYPAQFMAIPKFRLRDVEVFHE